jgi:hypothetical protein
LYRERLYTQLHNVFGGRNDGRKGRENGVHVCQSS